LHKTETLRDKKKVEIKNLKSEDMGKLMKFFRSIPKQDRKYLRIDVTDKKIVEQRFREIKKGYIFRIVALSAFFLAPKPRRDQNHCVQRIPA